LNEVFHSYFSKEDKALCDIISACSCEIEDEQIKKHYYNIKALKINTFFEELL
jgi:hypothetical protein